MSQYNKTVLTNAGLELAKRANAGQAKFEITRAVTSADDWSNKTIQDIEAVITIPNIMQQGTIMDTEEVESNNSVMGVSLCFTNKNLSAGYQIKIIGVYVKEEGQENDFLYAVTTAVSPEYMPDFSDKVLYRFNMQLYLVIGKTQAVNVVINDGASVTHGQFDKYKSEVTANLEKIENAHKEDMSHVVKSASINGGDEILPNEAGKLELVVPDPDLSKYVSLEQLTETLKSKADITAIPDKTATEEGIRQAKEMAQEADTKAQNALDTKADKTTVEENLATKANQSDLDQTNAEVAKKANSEDVTNQINSKTSGTIITDYDVASKTPTQKTDRYNKKWLVDSAVLNKFADQINQLKGRRQADAQDFNNLTDTGTYYVSNPSANNPTGSWGNLLVSNGDNHRVSQLYFPDDNSAPWYRTLDEGTWRDWVQLASASQASNAQNTATQANNNANTRLPLAGGTMNSNAEISFNNDAIGKQGGLTWNGSTDSAKIYGDVTAQDNLDLAFDLGDDGSNHFSFRRSGSETSAITSDGHYTGTVDWGHVNGRPEVTPIINGSTGDDLFAYKTNQLRLYPGNGLNCKNLPPASNTQWFTVQYIFENPNGDGVAIFRSPAAEVWINGNNGGAYTTGWLRLANSNDVNDLRNQIQQLRDNQFEVQTFTDATAAANWEAQKQGKRMAIVNS